jgi:hypothetical protein
LSEDDSSTTAKGEGKASSDTLLHFLRSLKLDKAQERISLLASEVGVNLSNDSQQPFSEVSGHILNAHRAMKERYEKTLQTLNEYKNRCEQLKAVFEPMPSDYSNPEHAADAIAQQQKLLAIYDAFKDLADDAERKRTLLREDMRRGKFNGIRDIPDQLLQPIRNQLHPVGGALNVIEKGVNQFKQTQLDSVNDLLPAMRPLLKVKAQPVPQALILENFTAETLGDVVLICVATAQAWRQNAEQCLKGTDVNFAQWQSVYKAVSEGNDPVINAGARDHLIKTGILKMRLTFASE